MNKSGYTKLAILKLETETKCSGKYFKIKIKSKRLKNPLDQYFNCFNMNCKIFQIAGAEISISYIFIHLLQLLNF